MKKVIILITFLQFTIYAKAQDVATKYDLLKNESQLMWNASYVYGGGHEGTLSFKSGSLNSALKGDFILDMNSIHNTDISPEEDRKGLEEHLRSEDFLFTGKFPNGFFSITKATPLEKKTHYTVTGFLTLKDRTNEINFPAIITTDENRLKVKAEVVIDRTRWGINHQSGSVFTSLKDGVISDEVKIMLELSFKKLN